MSAKIKFIIAVSAFGTIGFFVKNIHLSSAEIALYRGIIALIFLWTYLLLSKGTDRMKVPKRILPKLFLSGAAMGFNWILLFEAYRYTSVALSTLSYYFAPVIVVVLSYFIFKEKLGLKQILCFLGATAGLVLIIGISGKGEGSDLIGICLGLGAAVLYAFVILNNKSMKEADGIARTVYQFASAVVVLLPYVAVKEGFHLHQADSGSLFYLVIVGAFHTGYVYYLYFSSMSSLKGQEVAVLSYIDPVVAVLISVALLNEPTTTYQLFGGGLILISSFMNEINFKKLKVGNNPNL